jgi:hypothetical protein
MTDYTRRLERLEAEAARVERLRVEGPPREFAEVLREARERALQRDIDGEPRTTEEELAARRDEMWKRFRARRGR